MKLRASMTLPKSLLTASLFAFSLGLLSTSDYASSAAEKPVLVESLAPTPEQESVSRDIARQLQFAHYRAQKLDAEISSQVLDNYLKALDPQKVYLSEEDIKAFEAYRLHLDNAIKTGQLEPAFQIYRAYLDRMNRRLEKTLDLLAKGTEGLTFDAEESLEIDREEAPWAENQVALDNLWEMRIKSAILSQRLTGKKDEDIVSSLVKRYEAQKKRTLQSRSEDVFQTYMNALTNTYDPHTQYFSPRTSENFNINMSLSLEGIGAVLQSDNEFTKVVRLVPAGPADKNGLLQPADRIIGVGQGDNGEIINVNGWRLEEVVDLIRGPKQTVVKLEVIPAKSSDENETRVISIVRDKVKLEDQSAQSEVIKIKRGTQDYRLGVIYLPAFYADFRALQAGDEDARSTTQDVHRLIDKLNKDGIDGLIIDLRNNGGGALQEAISLTGLFIERGPTVQVRTADDRVRVYDDPDSSVAYNGPLAVLVNRLSASASEIFAAAIQDYGRGLIIGEQTFGKGTVQSVRNLSHGQLKITEAKFYRISGGSTQHKGVIPDLEMPSAIDKSEIGEDALPSALPWDQIAPVPFRPFAETKLLGDISTLHQTRMEKNPEYQALLKEIDYARSVRDQKELSLNEARRKAELEKARETELTIINTKRIAEGKDSFKNYGEFESWQEDQAARQEKHELIDFFTRESAEILVDTLTLEAQVATH